MNECQEPRCTKEATHNWGGRKVCQDHYEIYKEQQEKLLMDLEEIN